MRIAHFLPHYPGRDGSAAFCRGLSHAMNRLEPGSCPIMTMRCGEFRTETDEVLFHYPQTKSANPFSLPREMLLDLEANVHELDGFALHGTFNPPMAALGSHLRKLGIPYIFIPHDPYVNALLRHHRIRKAVYWRIFEKRLIEGAAAVQLLDASHEAPLRALGCDTRTAVIPNGCEPKMLRDFPENARIPGEQADDVKLLYFGRMDRNHKGLDILLKGFSIALEISPAIMAPVNLVMTGNDWTDRAELESLSISLGLGDRVGFTGRRQETAMEIVSEADLVILPSRFDGFGLCIVEAMLAGRPVLVSKAAGVASHVEKAGGGWLADPNPNSIAGALVKAVEDRKNWNTKGLQNKAYVIDHLTWDQIAVKTREAYASVFGVS